MPKKTRQEDNEDLQKKKRGAFLRTARSLVGFLFCKIELTWKKLMELLLTPKEAPHVCN
jgi:hypothetical protein